MILYNSKAGEYLLSCHCNIYRSLGLDLTNSLFSLTMACNIQCQTTLLRVLLFYLLLLKCEG